MTGKEPNNSFLTGFKKEMTIEICREIAARIWCDPAYSHMVMNTNLCEEIAHKLFLEAQRQ